MSNRWPLHPPPYLNESLSSWIARIANIYHMYFEDFLMNEFGINYESNSSYYIDLDPPLSLLTKLSKKTGITFDAVRALTAQAYTPLLIDTLKVEEINSFSDYVNQFNIFPRKKKPYYNDTFDLTMGNNWISWLDSKRFINTFGCESCLKEDKEPYLRLYWRFPWMMTCPLHKQLLKQVKLYSFTNHIEFYFIQDAEKLSHSIDNLCIIDEITLQAVTKGFVKTPAGYLHGGVWLRLLRSLIEELSLVQKNFSHEVLNVIGQLWKALGLLCRGGFYRYKVFEECDFNKQLILMLIASSALQSIFNNQIKFSTNGIKLLAPELIDTKDLCSVYSGYITRSEPSPPKTIGALMDDLIASMRSDPKVVVEFRNIIKAFDKSGKSLAGVDKNLKELGIQVIDDLI